MYSHIIILSLLGAILVFKIVFTCFLYSKDADSNTISKFFKKTNTIILIISLALLMVIIAFDINYFRYKEPIKYQDWETIGWSDFRAFKKPQQTLDGSQHFAFICSEIDVVFHEDSIKVQTLFHPARSFTYNQKTAHKNLLQHELYHLHITEYFARLIREKINTTEDQDPDIIKEHINALKEKERRMQRQYDDETYHGYVLSKQREWQHKIDHKLYQLNNYENPFIHF